MQVAGDAAALPFESEAVGLQAAFAPAIMLPCEADPAADQAEHAAALEPACLVEAGHEREPERRAAGVPDAVGVGGLDLEIVVARPQVGVHRGPVVAAFPPFQVVADEAEAETRLAGLQEGVRGEPELDEVALVLRDPHP